MPRPVGYGRPGTPVFPAGWQTNAARVVEGTLDCTVEIRPTGTVTAWNPVRRVTETVPAPPSYTGPAAVTPVSIDDGDQPTVAEDVVPVRRYEIALEHDASAVAVDHVVKVTASPNEPMLDGRRLKVTSVELGSRRFSRVIQAVDAE